MASGKFFFILSILLVALCMDRALATGDGNRKLLASSAGTAPMPVPTRTDDDSALIPSRGRDDDELTFIPPYDPCRGRPDHGNEPGFIPPFFPPFFPPFEPSRDHRDDHDRPTFPFFPFPENGNGIPTIPVIPQPENTPTTAASP